MNASGHLKAIGSNADAKPLLNKAGVEPDEGVTDLGGFVQAAYARAGIALASVWACAAVPPPSRLIL